MDGNSLRYPEISFLTTVKSNIVNSGSVSNVNISSVGSNSLALIFRIAPHTGNAELDLDFLQDAYSSGTSAFETSHKVTGKRRKSQQC